MADKVIRVGIAGQGRSGYNIHAAWLRQDPEKYRIVAVADQIPDRRAEAKRELGCRAYKDYKQLLKDEEVDLFVNSLPSNLHPKGTIEALRAGKHVVCEKPAAVKVRDFDKMVEAARKSRRVYAQFQNSRFCPFFLKAQEIIESGVLGRIVHCRLSWSGWSRRWDWQTRQDLWGGNLNNTGPHPMDHAVMLFGPKQPKVFARMKSTEKFFGDAEDFASVTLYGGRFDPVVEVLVSSCLAYPQGDQLSVNGTCGGLTGGNAGLKWKYFDPAKAPDHKLHKGWSIDRQYVKEKLPWKEKTWSTGESEYNFDGRSQMFYDNVHEVITAKGKLLVTPAQVRRQVYVLEEAHRQNPLPKGAKKWAALKKRKRARR